MDFGDQAGEFIVTIFASGADGFKHDSGGIGDGQHARNNFGGDL